HGGADRRSCFGREVERSRLLLFIGQDGSGDTFCVGGYHRCSFRDSFGRVLNDECAPLNEVVQWIVVVSGSDRPGDAKSSAVDVSRSPERNISTRSTVREAVLIASRERANGRTLESEEHDR